MGFPHLYVLHPFNTLLALLYGINQLNMNNNKKIAINIGKNMYIVFQLVTYLKEQIFYFLVLNHGDIGFFSLFKKIH